MNSENVNGIRPAEVLCNLIENGRCMTQSDTSVYYIDSHHLSMEATKLFAKDLKMCLKV
jgi:hypothetical protein